MPRKLNNSYRRQRRKDGPDLAFVELGGRRHYLGKYDTQESRERYHALLAEWEANGKQLLPDAEPPVSVTQCAAIAKPYNEPAIEHFLFQCTSNGVKSRVLKVHGGRRLLSGVSG